MARKSKNDPAYVGLVFDQREIAVLRFAMTYISDYEMLAQARMQLPESRSPSDVLETAQAILRKLPKEKP